MGRLSLAERGLAQLTDLERCAVESFLRARLTSETPTKGKRVKDTTTTSTLTARDLAAFGKLRISRDLLGLAQVRRVTDFEARNDFGISGQGDMDGILFPYTQQCDRWNCRLRRDHCEIENGKPVRKYIAPFGDTRHLYFPPGTGRVLENPRTAIVIVEAEKSSLAITAWAMRTGAADQFLAIATGGSWSWRGRRGKATDSSGARVDEVGALADLSVCVGRTVYVYTTRCCQQ